MTTTQIHFRGQAIDGQFPIASVRDSDSRIMQANHSFWMQWTELLKLGFLRSEDLGPATFGDSNIYLIEKQ